MSIWKKGQTMNRSILFCLMTAGCILFVSGMSIAQPRKEQWDAVQDAINRGLPKTAIEKLDPIIAAAKQEKAFAEAIKAVGMRIVMEGNIEGNKPEEKITRMQAEIDQAPAEMQSVMRAILASWYWEYFQQNRWRFMQRSQTAQPPGEDITTWDLPRILKEVDKRFQDSLASADELKKVPIATYDALLQKGNTPDSYRPTLYDFVANYALSFYSAAEQAGNRAEDAFDLRADSPIFADNTEFIAWKPATTDEASLKLHAIRLLQELIRFHIEETDKSALLDVELSRLDFGNNQATGEEKSARYKAALKRFVDTHTGHELMARALHDWATVVFSEEDDDSLVKARELAQRGLARFPNSIGGRRCKALIRQIEAPEQSVNTERVWNNPLPTINVTYRNTTKVYFRLVPFDFKQFVASQIWQPDQLDEQQRKQLLARTATKAWSADLPKTDNFRQRVEKLAAPTDIKPGGYYLISSRNESFSEQNNQVVMTQIWVSDLALVIRSHNGAGLLEGFVLNAISGEPISAAEIQVWARDNRTNQRIPMPSTKSDKNGLFQIRSKSQDQLLLMVTHKGHQLSTHTEYNNYINQPQPQRHEQTIFFTDRSLYRPGQTIQYKGICLVFDHDKDNYETIHQRDVTVVFSDANGEEIARNKHRSNNYGSVSGSFTAPRDRLTGSMMIYVEGMPQGHTQVSVEEYKRPKFQVAIEPPTEAAKLNGQVTVEAKATAYTGAAIDGAKVKWRVVREVRYPIWWFCRCWWMPPNQGGSQEIEHGTAVTEANGTFKISFIAKPDTSVAEESEPTFHFSIYADVTDTTGETRSAERTVNVGYTALAASIEAEDWQTDSEPVKLSISTTTLDLEPQAAEGTLKIYALKQPKKVARASLATTPYYYRGGFGMRNPPDADPTNQMSWPLGDVVSEHPFSTDATGRTNISTKLPVGFYRAKLETRDRFGKAVNAELQIRVIAPAAEKLALKVPHLFAAPKFEAEPGEEFSCVWGSGYDTARAFIEVEHRGKLIQSYWTKPNVTQVAVKQAVTEAMRGGFTVRTTLVRENRAYLETRKVDVPWSNKDLTLKWEHYVSKLEPAKKESWTLVIEGPDAKRASAELVAALYDASLDAYLPHAWSNSFNVFRQDSSIIHSQFENHQRELSVISYGLYLEPIDTSSTYRSLPVELGHSQWRSYGMMRGEAMFGGMGGMGGGMMGGVAMSDTPAALAEAEFASSKQNFLGDQAILAKDSGLGVAGDAGAGGGAGGNKNIDLSNVSARKNLNETAFFFPNLIADESGVVKLEFTMPEALTQWKFLGFAHDQQLRGGLLTDLVVTAKDLMIQPNPPRFLREGDEVEFTVKVSNQSATRQAGSVRLSFADARTAKSVDAQLGNSQTDLPFDIPAGESKSLSWRIKVADSLGVLTYKAVGSTGKLSDGEEGFLPVLSRRVLVAESLPLPIRGKQTKQFDFKKLRESAKSDSIKHQSLTVQMVSNPSWYAVMALPYLMEYPHECSEQTFNRLYANALAKHIADSDPKIHRVFEQWRNTPALDSPMEKNQDLKAVMLEETPWVRQALSESEARRNVGVLFDDNRLNDEVSRTLRKLSEMQNEDGAWSWFPGGRSDDYITLYIVTGFGRLRHLGVNVDVEPARRALTRLDSWSKQIYDDIKVVDRQDNHLTSTIALYLYGRSFFLEDQPVGDEHTEAVNYWIAQAKKYWLELDNRQSQAHLAIALKRFGNLENAKGIMASIKERSVSNEEMGMFWRDLELSWWWYRAPIETQAMMIEAFDEVMNDVAAVEDCKVWLLKQKQTQDWKTTKATADAVYALLLRGSDLLASDALVEVSLAGQAIKPEKIEAGTGFYEQRFVGGEIKAEQSAVSVKKVDDGVAWGSLHWQYLEDIGKVTPHDGTPLKLTKELYTRQNTPQGPKIQRVTGPVNVGDEVVVRVVLKTDRDMEYVHLRDHRGSGTEPVNVLSRYHFQDGLGYYESTRDTASHFFISYLPKGTYVFEYSTRVQLRGKYQTGFANVQCMYAPEFNSHSESLEIEAK